MAKLDRRTIKHEALLSALRAVWQARAKALDALAAKELAAANDPSSDQSIVVEREEFERAQDAVDHALKRLKWFEYRNASSKQVVRRVEPRPHL